MNELSIIGYLIRYYRKKSKLSMEQFILHNNKQICSKRTLIKIEHGEILSYEYYEAFCEKLNMSLSIFPSNTPLFNRIRSDVIESLITMSKNKMKELLLEIQVLLKKKHMIYFSELLFLYQDILNYHLYDQYPEDEKVNLYNYLLEIVEILDRKLILYFYYLISNIQPLSIDKESIAKQCKQFEEDPLFFSYKLSNIMNHYPLFSAYHQLSEIKENHLLNTYQILSINQMMSFCLMNANENTLAFQLMTNQIQNISFDNYPNSFVSKYLVRFSIIAYRAKKYDKAIELLLYVMKIKPNAINYNYFILFHLLEITNQNEVLKQILFRSNQFSIQNAIVHKIFTYYRMKHSISSKKEELAMLENYIIQNFSKLSKNSELYKDILLEELFDMIPITKDYKALYLFLK